MKSKETQAVEKIDIVPDAIYIKLELDESNSLTTYIWSQTDSEELQCLVRGMIARLSIDQEDWMHLGDYLRGRDGGLATMKPEGNA